MWQKILQTLFGEQKSPDEEKRAAFKSWQRQVEGEKALKLSRVISRDDPAVKSVVELSIRDPDAYFETANRDERLTSPADVTPFHAAWNALYRGGYLGFIDWKSDLDELKESLNPLLVRAGIEDFDWSFVDAIKAKEDWEALQNDNLLPVVGAKIRERKMVFVQINTLGDSYDFAVVTPAEFAEIEGLRGVHFEIDRFDQAV